MRKYCKDKDISHNIYWGENNRIYGDKWIYELGNYKVTLASESGCKIFDENEVIKKKINEKIKINPEYTYEQACVDFKLNEMEKYRACEISPKMFEAIALGTVLIMYPGRYRDILISNVHYIELKKDFSNIEEVMKKIHDDDYLQTMADTAYKDIVESGKYSYKTFINKVDSWLDEI